MIDNTNGVKSVIPGLTKPAPYLIRGNPVFSYRGRDSALVCATPPSEPDVRISRIRLSGRWFCLMRIGVRPDEHLQG